MTREKKVVAMKLSTGSIRRRGSGRCYAYRCQVNGKRSEISLETKDYHEALKKVSELVPIAEAHTVEVVAAHVNEARGFAKQAIDLALTDAWEVYAHQLPPQKINFPMNCTLRLHDSQTAGVQLFTEPRLETKPLSYTGLPCRQCHRSGRSHERNRRLYS